MKTLILACLLSCAYAVEVQKGYHEALGIPAAARAKANEAVSALSRIYGGSSSYLGDHPYMAGLIVNLTIGVTSLCGGSLLSNTKVLTAAHCWYDGYLQGNSILVVLGSLKVYSGGTREYATRVTWPSDFDPYLYAHDIAMLDIPSVAFTPYIAPISLPAGPLANSNFDGDLSQAIGFGNTNDRVATNGDQILREVYVTVLSYEQCNNYFDNLVTPNILCTKGNRYSSYGPCAGDAGGPLITRASGSNRDILIGVMSFVASYGCTTADYPAGHTRVTAYRSWIDSMLAL